jgi:hypothetical protein
MKKIYFGGNFKFKYTEYSVEKIANDYRARILGSVDELLHKPADGIYKIGNDIAYCGPFYFYEEGTDGAGVVRNELEMVDNCTHAVFVVDNTSIPGTVSEIVHASLKHKDIAIFYVKQELDENEPEKSICSANWYPIEIAKQVANAYIVECPDREIAEGLAYNYVEFLKRG